MTPATSHEATGIGRERKIQALAHRLRGVGATVVVGPGGCGKSALLHAAVASSQRRAHHGGGLALLADMPYLSLARALDDRPPRGRERVEAWVLAAVGSDLLVLDDAQWLDPPTLRLLPALAARIAIALAVREGDPAAATVLRALERMGAHRVALGLLSPGDALALARRLRPDAPVALAERAAARSHGDPLLLRAHLGLEDPARLRLLLGARVRRLTQRGQDAATRLAVLGRPAGEELLGAGAQELVRSGVAVRADGEVTFAHPAVAGAALAGLDSIARAGIHRLLAARMDDEAQAAHHHAAGSEPEAAQRKALAAAQRSASLTDRARLLAIAARCAPPGAGGDVAVLAGRALVEAGECAASEELLAPLVAAAGSNAPEAALQLARARRQLGRTDSARAVLAQVGEGAGTDAALKAELRVEEARNHLLDWEPDRALATAQQVLDDPALPQAPLARALLVVAQAADQIFDARCLEHYGQARALARAGREPILALEILALHARAVMAFGDAPGARRLVDEAIAEANALGQRRLELELRYVHSHLCLLEGSYDALAVESVALLEDPQLGGLAPRVRSDLAIVAADRGNDAQACHMLEGVLEPALSVDSRATLLWTWAEVHWLAGRPAEAAADARACLAVAPTWATLAGITLGWAAIDLGRRPPAPIEGTAYPLVAAARAESSGIAALGRPGGAPAAHRDLLRAAHERKGGYLRAELRCWWAAGEAAQRAGERDAAREHLLAVEARAQQHGFTALLGRIRRSLRGIGVPRPSPRGAPVGRLTHREHEVLRHVATGRTSVRIAAELGISAATVDAHARSAVHKLGARGRRHAALLATQGRRRMTSVAPLLLVAEGAGGTLRGAVDQLRAEGWLVQEGWRLPDVPWKLAQRRIACTGRVATGGEAVEVVLAALRGVALAVAVPDERLLERLAEDLHRIGDVQERTAEAAQPLERLDAEQRRLLEALADGATLEVAAQRLAWSRRTIDRRLAVIREVLGVSSTAEALMVLRGGPPA